MKKLILSLLLIAAGCAQGPRYVHKVNLPDNVYTQPMDVDDPIFVGLKQPPPAWTKEYGDSERSILLYNLIVVSQQYNALDKRIKPLESKKTDE